MKSIVTILFCTFALSGFCQIKVGVQAGYNHTTFSGHDLHYVTDYYYHASSLCGFNAGIITSVPLAKRLMLQPSLLLSQKGAKEESGSWGPYYSTHLRLCYAHLPVQVMYTFISRNQLQVSAGGGGFVSRGIWGNGKWSSERYDSTGQHYTARDGYKVSFTNDLYNYNSGRRNIKPWDYGYTLAAAAGWQSWQLKAAYDFGVTGVSAEAHKSGVFSLSAGYYFWGTKGKRAKK